MSLTGPAEAVEVDRRMLSKGTLGAAGGQRCGRGGFIPWVARMFFNDAIQRMVLAVVHIGCLSLGGGAIGVDQVNGLAGARRRLNGGKEMLALPPVSGLCWRRAIAVDVRGNGGERLMRVHCAGECGR